jgi:hypothetical protein
VNYFIDKNPSSYANNSNDYGDDDDDDDDGDSGGDHNYFSLTLYLSSSTT